MTQKTDIPQELLDKYRYVNVDYHDWWESVYELMKEDLELIGFEPADMQFSGFWSQGDGASFTGRIVEWDKFLDAIDPKGEEYPMLREAEDRGFKLYRSGHHYAHHNIVSVDYCEAYGWDTNTGNEVMDAIHDAWNDKLNDELREFEQDALEFLQDKMQDLYKNLREEYEYQTSDEQVADFILNNCPEEIEEYRKREQECEEAA